MKFIFTSVQLYLIIIMCFASLARAQDNIMIIGSYNITDIYIANRIIHNMGAINAINYALKLTGKNNKVIIIGFTTLGQATNLKKGTHQKVCIGCRINIRHAVDTAILNAKKIKIVELGDDVYVGSPFPCGEFAVEHKMVSMAQHQEVDMCELAMNIDNTYTIAPD